MQENQHSNPSTIEEPGLLDLVLVLAENLKLLIVGPVLVGLMALGIASVLPKKFQSVAVLQADQPTAALMTTAVVLDPVIAVLGLAKNETVEEARTDLRERVRATVGRTDKLLTLIVTAPTPLQAQAVGIALLQKTFEESRPKGSVLVRLRTQLSEAQERLTNAQSASAGLLKRLQNSGTAAGPGVDLAKGYADLLSAIGAAQTQVSALETLLEGVTSAQLLQPPTLPERAIFPRKGLIASGTALGTVLALLMFIFMRHAFGNYKVSATTSEKLLRIRRSVGLK